MPRLRNLIPNPALTLTTFLWAFNFVVVKLIEVHISLAAVGLVRFLCVFSVLAIYCKLTGLSLKYPAGKDRWRLLIGGFLANGCYMVLFLIGMNTAGASEAAIASATSPLFVAILSVLAKHEKLTARLIAGSLLAFCGVAMVVINQQSTSHGEMRGNLLILASAFVWSVSVIVMRPVLDRMPATQVFTLALPPAALALVPFGFLAVRDTAWGSLPPIAWLLLTYMVLLSGVVAFILYYKGIGQVGSAKGSLVSYCIPPLSAVFAWLAMSTPLGAWQIVGLFVVLGGVALAAAKKPTAPDEFIEPAVS